MVLAPPLAILQDLALVALVTGVGAYIYKTFRDSTEHYDQDTITRLKDSNDILRQENVDLKAQITAMELRVHNLEQANVVLKNIVTGSDTLADLQKTIALFLPYAQQFEVFVANDKIILERLATIEAIIKSRTAVVSPHHQPHVPKKRV